MQPVFIHLIDWKLSIETADIIPKCPCVIELTLMSILFLICHSRKNTQVPNNMQRMISQISPVCPTMWCPKFEPSSRVSTASIKPILSAVDHFVPVPR